MLQSFKEVVHPKQLDIQELNHTARDLTKDSPTEQSAVIKDPMTEVNRRWEELLNGVADRKVSLQIMCFLIMM